MFSELSFATLILGTTILMVCCNDKNLFIEEQPIIFSIPRQSQVNFQPPRTMVPRNEFVPAATSQQASTYIDSETLPGEILPTPYTSLSLDEAFKFGYEAGRIISSQDNEKAQTPYQLGREMNKNQPSKQSRCILGIYDLIFPQPKYYAREPSPNTPTAPMDVRRSATVLGRQPLFVPPQY